MKTNKENELMILVHDKKISIELCDNNSGNSSAYCDKTSRCSGANNSNCRPNNVWSGNVNGSSNAYYYNLNSGSWNQNNNYRTRANSVRCVTDFLEKCLVTRIRRNIFLKNNQISKHCLEWALNLQAQGSV